MAGNVPVVSEQFVVPFDDAPRGDPDADNPSGSLLSFEQQSITDLLCDTCELDRRERERQREAQVNVFLLVVLSNDAMFLTSVKLCRTRYHVAATAVDEQVILQKFLIRDSFTGDGYLPTTVLV